MATIGFFALAVFCLGALSLLTDTDLIAVPGLGQIPGIIGMLAAVVAFALMLAGALRRRHPSYFSVPAVALVCALVHLVVVAFAVLVVSSDMVTAIVVAGAFVQGGASAVLLLTAAVSAWAGIALRRTRAKHPRWPWEREEEE